MSTVITGGNLYVLDLAAKLDQTAEYLCAEAWKDVVFPPTFGLGLSPEVLVV